ncbi:hypothetical protein ACJ72_00162 [Emergomyces africanus]|uniref:RNA-dependent RNA polymerase n=1 Tax=Emergomyces africanus TaxID=1955775 RepID=A0A1B7P981_9EURO|nr:hypothetical protein ACJ72_00162 [Emergomyces africanus]
MAQSLVQGVSPRYGRRLRMDCSPPAKRFGNKGSDFKNTALIIGEWASWDSVSVTLARIPRNVNTFTLWKSFSAYGCIDFIEIFENARGRKEGEGRIRFKPPPREAFWTQRRYLLLLENDESVSLDIRMDPQRPVLEIKSPIQQGVKYPATIELPAHSVEFGSMVGRRSFLQLRSLVSNRSGTVRLVLDLAHRELCIYAKVPNLSAKAGNSRSNTIPYRFRIRFSQLTSIWLTRNSQEISLTMPLDSPTICHQQITSLESEHFPSNENVWNSQDTWLRQIDIAHYPDQVVRTPVNLRKQNSYINFGRWTTFRLGFHKNTIRDGNKFQVFNNILRDFNIQIQETDDLQVVKKAEPIPTVWKWIDAPSTHKSRPLSSMEDLEEDEYTPLPFPVRYQLEVCLSNQYLNEYTIDEKFVHGLVELGETKAKELLEHVATNKSVYYDPMEIFNIPFPNGASSRIPEHCCYMRSADVTPSTIYYGIPSVDTSNRVLRYYREYADRFLRVRFCDEKYLGRIYPNNNGNKLCMREVYGRVMRALQYGIIIGDRRYEFLAFGNSQFREHGAYFFASLPHLTAANIRARMGDLNDIKVVAKYAARLGQCFSTTRAVTGCPVQLVEIEDIERNGYVFSDGVGRLSHFLTQMIQSELGIKTPSGEPPSVFQFRLGGCKGILAVSPDAHQREVHIRKSQYKFPATHNGLEIIRHSHFSLATLNRQLILVLSSLGVPDQVFLDKLRMMLVKLERAMTNEEQAVHLLQTYVDPNQMTLVLADMVRDGFQKSQEPFVSSLLELWRTWQIKYLKEKAKIAIDKGAYLLGCVDETKTLKGYFHSARPAQDATYEEKVECLPEIFLQVWRHDQGEYSIIKGLCILARNPSLHPGDIRVVKAVDVPALYHLRDVVVLPQTGDRDVSSMCSGGDLDGDDYVVIWDEDMLPRDWFHDPMDYSAPKPVVMGRDVTVDDITKFYATYMQNDRLPQIALAHLALADFHENGVRNEKCIQLAALHSAAVDYNKSGIPVNMTRDLKPRKWPHFMEKKLRNKNAEYISPKILGQLYDIASGIDSPSKSQFLYLQETAQFDERILNSGIEIDDALMGFATELKTQYEGDMRRIMAQHDIKTEFEVWSTFVLAHSEMTKDYKFHEDIGRISSALREKFRMLCHEKAGGKEFKHLAPLAVAMYKVTSDQMRAARAANSAVIIDDSLREEKQLPLISFPWILQPILGRIANEHFENAGSRKSCSAHIQVDIPRGPKPKKFVGSLLSPDVETADGVKHAGNVLQLFGDTKLDPFDRLGEMFDDTAQITTLQAENIPQAFPEFNGQKGENAGREPMVQHIISLTPSSSQKRTTYISDSQTHFASSCLPTTQREVIGLKLGNTNKQRTIQGASELSGSVAATRKREEVEEVEEVEEFEEEIIEFETDLRPSALDELERLIGGL